MVKPVKVLTKLEPGLFKDFYVSPVTKVKVKPKPKVKLKSTSSKKAEIEASNAKLKQKLQELQADPDFPEIDISVRRYSNGQLRLFGPEGQIDIKRLGGKISNNVAYVLKIRNNK